MYYKCIDEVKGNKNAPSKSICTHCGIWTLLWLERNLKIYSIKSVQAQWGQNIFQIVFEYYNFTNILAFTHQIGEIISRYQITL